MSVPSIFLDQLFARKICAFAGCSLLVYDYLLTFSMEVVYIWHTPWTLVKALFLINRYGNLFGQTVVMLGETGYLSLGSQEFCFAFQIYCSAFGVFSGETIRLLVVMRACAILRCRRSIALVLKTVYILYAFGMLVTVNYLLSKAHPHFIFLSETGICFTPVPPNIWMVWFILLFFDGVLLVIVCHNLYLLNKGSYGAHPLRLIRLLARDTLLFYFMALFNVLFCIICWSVYSQDPRNFIQILISCPAISVVGQRLILNLRRFRGQQGSTYNVGIVVNREIAVMGDDGYRLQSGREVGAGSTRGGTNSGMIRMVDLHSDHGPGQEGGGLGEDVWGSRGVGGEETMKSARQRSMSLSEDVEWIDPREGR